jgi:hypothetical protein
VIAGQPEREVAGADGLQGVQQVLELEGGFTVDRS